MSNGKIPAIHYLDPKAELCDLLTLESGNFLSELPRLMLIWTAKRPILRHTLTDFGHSLTLEAHFCRGKAGDYILMRENKLTLA